IRISSTHLLFFFHDPATTEIYTLSLHDALPIWWPRRPTRRCSSGDPGAWRRGGPRRSGEGRSGGRGSEGARRSSRASGRPRPGRDRKSTRLNSSHLVISYAVFCLKKKKNKNKYR